MKKEQIIQARNMALIQASRKTTVRHACALFDVSHTTYYKLKKRYMQYGIKGLMPKVQQPPNMPNKTPDPIEEKIVEFSIKHPTYGRDRVASELLLHEQIDVSPGCIQRIFTRHNMRTVSDRLKLYEERYLSEDISELDIKDIELMAEFSEELKEKHVVSKHPGYLLCQDTFSMGYLKGIGKLWAQGVIDTYGSYAFMKVYNRKSQKESSDILLTRVLPFYKSMGIPVRNILTDNGKEYCGTLDHDYECLLAGLGIDHRRTQVRSPQTNGFIERFNRTVKEEFIYLHFNYKWYYGISEIQRDLDKWLNHYNVYRTHQGYRTKGRTPYQVLLDFSTMPRKITC